MRPVPRDDIAPTTLANTRENRDKIKSPSALSEIYVLLCVINWMLGRWIYFMGNNCLLFVFCMLYCL